MSCRVKTYVHDKSKIDKWRISYARTLATHPELRKKLSEGGKKPWMNPETVARIKKSISECHKTNPLMIAARKRAQEAYWRKYGANGLLKIAELGHIKIRQKCQDDPNFRLKMFQNFKITDPEVLEKIRHSPAFLTKEKWQDPIFREKMAQIRPSMPVTSSQQYTLYSILDTLNIRYYKDIDPQSKIGFYTYDCLIPIQDNLTRPLIIEVQGDYWHNLPDHISRDKAKAVYLQRYFPQYDLRYLWEHEFKNPNRITELLKYWLGQNKLSQLKLDFSGIVEKQIIPKDAEIFIGKYHYAGRLGRSGINLGYFYENTLITVIIYASPIRQEIAIKQGLPANKILELSRLCIHPQYQVKNLASFLIARSIQFLKKKCPEIECLVSFADSTHNHLGTIYKASNWKLDGKVTPDYWYVDQNKYIYHKKTIWDRAQKLGILESEYYKLAGYQKVWGNSKHRFIYRLKNT
jgi:hypothetical protein